MKSTHRPISHAALQGALFCFVYCLVTVEFKTGHLTSMDLSLEKEAL